MEKEEFKKIFSDIAFENKFIKAYGSWYKKSEECIIVLDLQKSNYSNLYYLNIRIYIQGVFNMTYTINKYLIKNDIGTLDTRIPKEQSYLLDLENNLKDIDREEKIKELFQKFVNPFVEQALSRNGIKELVRKKLLYNLPNIMEQL